AAFLRRALASPEELVRLEAVRAWGQRSKASPAVVLPLTKDSSWRVQLEAIEALRRLSGKPATDHLTKLPPGLHLPKIAPFATAPATTGPLPASPQKPGIPTDDQAILQPLLGPVLPALMNGPMPGPHPRVRIVTSKGAIVVRLYPEWAPYTVANFLNLVDSGYYDGLRFFRVVPDFVVQTGDRSNTGEGDAGYTVGAELNPVEERSGVLAMALEYQTGHAVRDSAGTQFYITISPQLHLDRDFTVFGEIQTGFGVLAHLIESDRMLHLERIADG
ncbi:MAG: peptidylprolyl isomerase, partial [Vulcanimicrobiaceae bacterium]